MAFFAGVYAPARAAAVADAPADVFGTDLFADGDAGPPRLDLAPFLTDFFPPPPADDRIAAARGAVRPIDDGSYTLVPLPAPAIGLALTAAGMVGVRAVRALRRLRRK
ncbi:MAG TPA: hypothetical protein VF624_12615 [Tepidisphaeraceae bacterium]